jgi:hypothetical protein
MPRILVATANGLHELGDGAAPGGVHHTGRALTTVAQDRKGFWTIVDGAQLWHSDDLDRWAHLADLTDHRGTCLAAMDDDVLVGSSEARLFRVAGERLEPVAAFDRAEGRSTWYTPWGGPPDTRSISEWAEAVYVNVHVGGILRTEDRGETWTPTIDIDADVHQVATAEGLVLAAAAGGLAVSTDRGRTWTFRSEGLEAPYSRAVAVSGDSVLVSASNGPRGGHAAVYRGALGGDGLTRCRTGLPEWFDDNIDSYCLDAHPDRSFVAFGTSDGRVFASEDAGHTWAEFASGLPPVRRVLVLL